MVGLKTSSANSTRTEAVRVREKLDQHPAYTGKAFIYPREKLELSLGQKTGKVLKYTDRWDINK